MKFNFFKSDAFTLLEIFLVIFIVGIISTLFYSAYFDSSRAVNFNKTKIEFQREEDIISNWFKRYLLLLDFSEPITVYTVNTIIDPETGDTNNLEEISFYTFNNSDDKIFYTPKTNNGKYNLYLEIPNRSVNKKINDFEILKLDFVDNGGYIKINIKLKNDDSNDYYSFSSIVYPRVQN